MDTTEKAKNWLKIEGLPCFYIYNGSAKVSAYEDPNDNVDNAVEQFGIRAENLADGKYTIKAKARASASDNTRSSLDFTIAKGGVSHSSNQSPMNNNPYGSISHIVSSEVEKAKLTMQLEYIAKEMAKIETWMKEMDDWRKKVTDAINDLLDDDDTNDDKAKDTLKEVSKTVSTFASNPEIMKGFGNMFIKK